MPVKRKTAAIAEAQVAIRPPHARDWQLAGAAARRNSVDERLASALDAMAAELAQGKLIRVPTYADVLRRAKIDRKSLFNPKFPDRAGLVDGFLRKAGAAPKVKQPAKPKKPTFYERISVNAQEAEAVRLLKQAAIDTLQLELSDARKEIAALRAGTIPVRGQPRNAKPAAKRAATNGTASNNLGA